MKTLFRKIRFAALVIADDAAIIVSMFFRRRIEEDAIGTEA